MSKLVKITAALFRRSDSPCFRLHVGVDYEEVALALSAGHAFSVETLIVLPRVAAEAPDQFRAYVLEHADPLPNDWFSIGSSSMENVLSALLACCYKFRSVTTTPSEAVREEPSEPGTVPPRGIDNLVKVEPTLWDLVEGCETADASTVTALRTHLEGVVGKEGTVGLLGDVKATSGRDRSSRKQRIFTIDGKAIRIKPS